jgi:hypothetical protein
MVISAKVAPPYSVVVITDPSGGQTPDTMSGSIIAATESCIAVGCLCDIDGETEFTLGAGPEVDPGSEPTFQGTLQTPNRRIVVRSVYGETILELPVLRETARVRIWVNHPSEPDRVVVGAD